MSRRPIWGVMACATVLMCALASHTANADPEIGRSVRVVHDTSRWGRVPDEDLESLRGGFGLDDGLLIAFSIERTVGIDGDSKTTTISWPGGAFNPAFTWATVQNRLNGQRIQVSTIINASVSELALLRALSLQATLQQSALLSLHH
jgi:hypothetical protein